MDTHSEKLDRALCPRKTHERQPDIEPWCTSTIFLSPVQNLSNHIHWTI